MRITDKIDEYFVKNDKKGISDLLEEENNVKKVYRNGAAGGIVAVGLYALSDLGLGRSLLGGCGIYTALSLGWPALEYVSAKAYVLGKGEMQKHAERKAVEAKKQGLGGKLDDVKGEEPVVSYGIGYGGRGSGMVDVEEEEAEAEGTEDGSETVADEKKAEVEEKTAEKSKKK